MAKVASIELQFENVTATDDPDDTERGDLTVFVIGAEGKGIDGATVTIRGPENREKESTNGAANFPDVPVGDYGVSATKSGEEVEGFVYSSDFQEE